MDSHIAALQTFVASVDSLRVEALDPSTDSEPQQLISHKFHCYVMTLMKTLIPVVIRDIPVSASYPIHLFCFVLHVESPFSCRETPDDQYPSPRAIDHRTITLWLLSPIDYFSVTRCAVSGAFTGVFAAPPSTAQAVLRDRHQSRCVSLSRCGPLRRRTASTSKSPAIYRPSHQIIHMGVTGAQAQLRRTPQSDQ